MSTEDTCMFPASVGEKKVVVKPEREQSSRAAPSQLGGTVWFIGWLFTIGFAELVWWKALLALVAWPYFLGIELRL